MPGWRLCNTTCFWCNSFSEYS